MHMNRQVYQSINHQSGFTIIELMISTAVFSLILLVAIVAIISTTDTFVKGNIQSQTQDSARNVLTAITQDIQFNKAGSVSGSYADNQGYYCIGNDVYVYQTNEEINASSTPPVYHALLVVPGSCPTSLSTAPGTTYMGYLNSHTGGGSSTHELLSQDLSLGQLSITEVNGTSYEVSLTVAYGNDVITTTDPDSCPAQSLGGQLCAVSTLTTTVTPRIQ